MSNGKEKSLAQKLTYRRRTLMGALAGGSLVAIGSVPAAIEGHGGSDEGGLIPADEVRPLVSILSSTSEEFETDAIGCAQLVPVEDGLLFHLVLDSIECVTQAHIHEGARDEEGPVVGPLVEYTESPDGTGGAPRSTRPNDLIIEGGRIEDEELSENVQDSPEEYYVNVHTIHNPGGEIRGQLLRGTIDDRREPLPAKFEVTSLDPETVTATAGDSFDITATVENLGDVTETQGIVLSIDGEFRDEQSVELSCRESATISFSGVDTSNLDVGEHSITVSTDDGLRSTTLTLEETDDASDESDGGPGDDTGADETEEGDIDEDADGDAEEESEETGNGDTGDESDGDGDAEGEPDETDDGEIGEDADGDSDDESDGGGPEDGSSEEGTGDGDTENETDEESGSDSDGDATDSAEFSVSGVHDYVGRSQGDTFDVSATIENVGEGSDTQTVDLRVAGETRASREVTLEPGDSTPITFDGISTADIDPGEYEYGVFTDDDQAVGTLSVGGDDDDLEAPEFVITNMEPQQVTVTQGERYQISVTVENVGEEAGMTPVELVAAGYDEALKQVELAPGDSTTVTLESSAHNLDPGEYDLSVIVNHDFRNSTLTVQEEEDSGDNGDADDSGDGEDESDDDPREPEFVIANIEPNEVTVPFGDRFDISVTVENVGDAQGEYLAELELALTEDAVQRELGPGESETITLTGHTGDESPGEYDFHVHLTFGTGSDLASGTVHIEEEGDTDDSEDSEDGTEDDGDGEGGTESDDGDGEEEEDGDSADDQETDNGDSANEDGDSANDDGDSDTEDESRDSSTEESIDARLD